MLQRLQAYYIGMSRLLHTRQSNCVVYTSASDDDDDDDDNQKRVTSLDVDVLYCTVRMLPSGSIEPILQSHPHRQPFHVVDLSWPPLLLGKCKQLYTTGLQ